jgi:hypothetical protein
LPDATEAPSAIRAPTGGAIPGRNRGGRRVSVSGSNAEPRGRCAGATATRASMVVELLAEVPIAASLGRIGPIPTQVDGLRRRHSIDGDDGAQCDTVKAGPVVGLLDPRPHRPHDRCGFHSHSAAPAHRNMGPTSCDASMSNCDMPGSDRDASMSSCDVTSFDDASMSNRDVTASDGDTSMSNCNVAGHRDICT